MSAERVEHVLARFDAWAAGCEAAEYTDTGEAWEYLNTLAALLRSTLQLGCFEPLAEPVPCRDADCPALLVHGEHQHMPEVPSP